MCFSVERKALGWPKSNIFNRTTLTSALSHTGNCMLVILEQHLQVSTVQYLKMYDLSVLVTLEQHLATSAKCHTVKCRSYHLSDFRTTLTSAKCHTGKCMKCTNQESSTCSIQYTENVKCAL